MRTKRLTMALLAVLAVAGTAAAQSFLGTIRGTVVDPQAHHWPRRRS